MSRALDESHGAPANNSLIVPGAPARDREYPGPLNGSSARSVDLSSSSTPRARSRPWCSTSERRAVFIRRANEPGGVFSPMPAVSVDAGESAEQALRGKCGRRSGWSSPTSHTSRRTQPSTVRRWSRTHARPVLQCRTEEYARARATRIGIRSGNGWIPSAFGKKTHRVRIDCFRPFGLQAQNLMSGRLKPAPYDCQHRRAGRRPHRVSYVGLQAALPSVAESHERRLHLGASGDREHCRLFEIQ